MRKDNIQMRKKKKKKQDAKLNHKAYNMTRK